MDLRKRWKGCAEVVSLTGFAGVAAQDERKQKETKSRKRKEKIIRNREMRQDIQLTLDSVRWPDWSLACVDAVICPPSRFGLAPGIGAAFTSITARIQFGRAGVYDTENACNAMSPGTNGKEPCAKLQLQHRPALVPDGYSVLFPLIRQAHHIRCSFALSRRDPPRPHSKRAKRNEESTNSKRVSTEAESETDPVAGDDALAYIRRRAVQPSPTSLHMQGISSMRTSTSSCS
ncbi:hypothetical protein HDV62DRAFT_252739 [Trichoderma sp. SZMC 28011]